MEFPSCKREQPVIYSIKGGTSDVMKEFDGFVDEHGDRLAVCRFPEGAPYEWGLYKYENPFDFENVDSVGQAAAYDLLFYLSFKGAHSLGVVLSILIDKFRGPPPGTGGGKSEMPEMPKIDWTSDIWTKCGIATAALTSLGVYAGRFAGLASGISQAFSGAAGAFMLIPNDMLKSRSAL